MYERVKFKNGRCPDCDGDRFWEGPSGGACTNICCMYCLSAFNIGPGSFAERIPNTHFVENGAKAQPRPPKAEVPKLDWLSRLMNRVLRLSREEAR